MNSSINWYLNNRADIFSSDLPYFLWGRSAGGYLCLLTLNYEHDEAPAGIGQPIRSLQTMLRTIAQADDSILPVVPDGIYGKDTLASVSSFQQRHGLPLTGITDLDTWNAIVDEYHNALVEVAEAEHVMPILQPGQVIRRGETNDHLYMMHGMLRAIAGHFPSMPPPPYGNTLDSSSAACVIWLQLRAGLPPTGNIDRHTWRHLAKLYRTTVGDGTAPSVSRKEAEPNALEPARPHFPQPASPDELNPGGA